MPDFIPASDANFNVFFKNIVDYVDERTGGNKPVWDFIPSESLDTFHEAWNAWDAAYQKTLVPHTPVDTKEKNRARKSSKKELRLFTNRFLRYPPVTDEDRDNMGVPNRKDGRSPVPVPTTSPILLINTGTRRRVIINYRDEQSLRRGKPRGVHGIEVRWAVLDRPPQNEEELIHSAFDTRSPLVLEFREEDRGKRVYLAGRWEIEREGKKGPFSAIEEAVIP
jgi:hypothetical protein